MTEFEAKILSELTELRTEVSALRSEFSISKLTYFESLNPSAIVGTDYVAYRFNCSESAVIRGRFETDKIPRIRQKPIAFRKRDVDAVWMNINRTAAEKAAGIRNRQNKVGKRKNKI